MAHYMVKKKIIGRMFDILHNGHKLNKHFRKYNDVPFKEIVNMDIGLPTLTGKLTA